MSNISTATWLQGIRKCWLLIVAFLLCILYQLDNIPRTDDEYLGEQVYWLLKTGKVKSDFGYSDLGYDLYQSIYHKLFIYSGYVSGSVFGWSLYSLHIISYVCFLAFLVIFIQYCRQHPKYNNSSFAFPFLFLILCNQDLLYAIGDFRPEIMIMALGFAAYILLEKYLEQNRKSALVFSACCSGLCMFAHLNGIIFIGAGCLLLLVKKRYLASVMYGFIAGLTFLPYFADVLYLADFRYFLNQFQHDPVLHSHASHWYDPFLNLIREQSRFLFTEKQIILTASLIIILLFSYKKIKQASAPLLIYTLVLILSLAVVCPSKSTKYMVLYLPFLYLILTEGWLYIESTGNRKRAITVRSFLIAGVAISLFYSGKQISRNIENLRSGGLIAEHKALTDKIDGNHKALNLLAPRIMVFNEVGAFKRLEDIGMVASEHFKAHITRSDIDYIVFAAGDREYFHLDQLLQESGTPLLLKDSTAHYILTAVKR